MDFHPDFLSTTSSHDMASNTSQALSRGESSTAWGGVGEIEFRATQKLFTSMSIGSVAKHWVGRCWFNR